MRFAYLDEAGISNPKHEPYAVVAGVVVNMDSDFRRVEAKIREAVDKYIPNHVYRLGENFSFHSKDLWHGSGLFPRDIFSVKQRMDVLSTIANIIFENNLPIVFGYVDRERVKRELSILYLSANLPLPSNRALLNAEISKCFFRCFKRIEYWMRNNAPQEVCSIAFENNDENRKLISNLQQVLVNKVDRTGVFAESEYFQSNHIVEGPIFLNKRQSPIIQLSDIAAFVLKRKLQKCTRITPIFDIIEGNISHATVSGDTVSLARQPDAIAYLDNVSGR